MTNDDFGARVYKTSEEVILVKQTIKKPDRRYNQDRYVVDCLPDGTHKERHVDVTDDKTIAEAIRDALNGKLI